MLRITVLALVFGIAVALPAPEPLPIDPGIPGAAITTTHHSSHAHHPIGLGYGGYGMGYPVGGGAVVKNTEVVSSGYGLGGYGGYGGYGAYPGLGGMGYGGYGYPGKQVTQVTTTAVRPGGFYGYGVY